MSKVNTRATINANIKQNGNQEITGQVLNSVLNTMVDDYAEQEKLTELESEVSQLEQEIGEKILVVSNPSNSVAYFIDIVPGGYIEKCTYDSGILSGTIYFLDENNSIISDPSILEERTIIVPNNTASCYVQFASANTATNIQLTLQNRDGVWAAIDKKVDKETGKGLSKNDFTDGYKDEADTLAELLYNPIGAPIVGKMYDGNCQLIDNSNSIYHTATNLSAFAGKTLTIKLKNATTSGRYMGIGVVDTGWITSRAELSPSYVIGDISVYKFTIPSSGDVLVSYTKTAKLVGVSVEENTTQVFVSPSSGYDNNEGTSSSPMRTIAAAIKKGENIILKSGIYYESGIDLSLAKENINIFAEPNSKVFIVGGVKLLESDGELVSGSTKVYAKNIGESFNLNYKWIFQLFTADSSTSIPNAERTTYHRGRAHRCGEIVAIKKVASIAEVESSNDYAFYYESGYLYYSRPQSVSASNPLYISGGNLFTNTTNKCVNADGISVFCCTVNLHNMNNCVWKNCSVFGAGDGAGFSIKNSRGISLQYCEAARTQNGTGVTGDGFNMHSDIEGSSEALTKIYTEFELINCWSHDNNNDGYSDHEGCKGYINGGLFEHNCISGNGAGITPSFGAHDVIENAITQYNGLHGLLYSGDGVEADKGETWGSIQVVSCISRYNQANGFAQFNQYVASDYLNCVSYGNTMHGFYGASNRGSIMRCINCKSLNNVGDKYKLVSDNIGSI